jgi:hypothetical protein
MLRLGRVCVKSISSRQNPVVRTFRELARSSDPAGTRVLLDGAHLVAAARDSSLAFEVVAVSASRLRKTSEEGALAEALESAGVRVVAVPEQVFRSMSQIIASSWS